MLKVRDLQFALVDPDQRPVPWFPALLLPVEGEWLAQLLGALHDDLRQGAPAASDRKAGDDPASFSGRLHRRIFHRDLHKNELFKSGPDREERICFVLPPPIRIIVRDEWRDPGPLFFGDGAEQILLVEADLPLGRPEDDEQNRQRDQSESQSEDEVASRHSLMSEATYRLNVAAILRNARGEILICERLNIPGAWQFPQGGIDEGETPEEALARELGEEIGIERRHFRIVERRGPYRYLFGNGRTKKGWHGKEQIYFLCDFIGTDADITVETGHPEFRAYRWIAPKDFRIDWLPEMKREVYRAVFDDFFGVRI